MSDAPVPPNPFRAVRLDWVGEGLRFSGGGVSPPSPAVAIDGAGETGPAPMQVLLLACAGCAGADVVSILRKMRLDLTRLAVEVEGVRREDEPRRYVSIHFRFVVVGDGIEPAQAERAVRLSLERYCSVVHTLAADLRVTSEVLVTPRAGR